MPISSGFGGYTTKRKRMVMPPQPPPPPPPKPRPVPVQPVVRKPVKLGFQPIYRVESEEEIRPPPPPRIVYEREETQEEIIHVVRRRAKPKEPKIIYVDDDEPPEPQVIYLDPGPQEPPQIVYASQPGPQIIVQQQSQPQSKVIYLGNTTQTLQPQVMYSQGRTRSAMSTMPNMNDGNNNNDTSRPGQNQYQQPQVIYLNQEPQQFQYVIQTSDSNGSNTNYEQPQVIYLNGPNAGQPITFQ